MMERRIVRDPAIEPWKSEYPDINDDDPLPSVQPISSFLMVAGFAWMSLVLGAAIVCRLIGFPRFRRTRDQPAHRQASSPTVGLHTSSRGRPRADEPLS